MSSDFACQNQIQSGCYTQGGHAETRLCRPLLAFRWAAEVACFAISIRTHAEALEAPISIGLDGRRPFACVREPGPASHLE